MLGTAPSVQRSRELPAGLSDFRSPLKTGCKIQMPIGRDHKLLQVQPQSSGRFLFRGEAPCSCSGTALERGKKGLKFIRKPQVLYSSEKAASHELALGVGLGKHIWVTLKTI